MTASGILPVTSQCGGLLALDRLNPHERSFFVVLLLDGSVPNFQSGIGQTLQSFSFTVVAKTLWFRAIHRSTRPLRLIQSLRRRSRPASATPRCSRSTDPAGSVGGICVIEGSNSIERANFKRYFAHISFEKRFAWDCSSSSDDLLCRSINADDGVTKCSKITRDWDARTTAEIENPAPAGRQAFDTATHPFLTYRRSAEAFKVDICDFVVA
jgi:hypothetical protein